MYLFTMSFLKDINRGQLLQNVAYSNKKIRRPNKKMGKGYSNKLNKPKRSNKNCDLLKLNICKRICALLVEFESF